jgi:hypothetical protein
MNLPGPSVSYVLEQLAKQYNLVSFEKGSFEKLEDAKTFLIAPRLDEKDRFIEDLFAYRILTRDNARFKDATCCFDCALPGVKLYSKSEYLFFIADPEYLLNNSGSIEHLRQLRPSLHAFIAAHLIN